MGGYIVGRITDEDIEQVLYPKMKEYWDTDREKYSVFKEAVDILLDWGLRVLIPWWEHNNYSFDLFSSTDHDDYDGNWPNYILLWPDAEFHKKH